MSHIKPNDVSTPKNRWKLDYVIYDQGEGGFAVAYGKWKNDPSFALRWNGTSQKPKGNPTSRGNPTWFIVPLDIGISIVQTLLFKQAIGNEHTCIDNLRKALMDIDEIKKERIDFEKKKY